jgi:CubicO group peptidase (beta-lactamase class C family)
VGEGSIYDVASITKAVPVSCLALQLLESGRLSLDDRLIDFVPAFRNPDKDLVRIRHLLTHTLHFAFPLSSMRAEPPEEIMRALLENPFASKPGSHFSYANATSILLGLVVENIFGGPLDRVADEIFFKPLGMHHTAFHPLQHFDRDRIVPSEVDASRGGVVQGEVHDESAWQLSQGKGHAIPGSAGLFSSAEDLLIFSHLLLNGGARDGQRFFSESTIRSMHTNQISSIGGCTGLGWELNQKRFMGNRHSENTFGKTGFTGCSLICEMERGIGWVLLSNCTYPRRKPNREAINEVRRDTADIILEG